MTAGELAAALGAGCTGDASLLIRGAGSLDSAGPGDLSFIDGARNFQRAKRSRCSVVIAPAGYEDPAKTVLTFDPPRLAFARALGHLYPDLPIASGVDTTAVIAPTAKLGAGAGVGSYTVIGGDSSVGARTQIGALVTVGQDVEIGSDCRIYSGVRIYPGVRIGNGCILHSGCVIGSDGLGFVLTESGYEKFPQRGGVVIEDDVEVGANTTIDRGAIDNTVIRRNTKLDNLIHIAHNCVLGESCVVAAQTGIAGSTTIGNRVSVGGQVGIADHVIIEDGAILGAQAGIPTGKRIRAGKMVWGTPARPMDEFREQYRNLLSIGELRGQIETLEAKVAALEERLRSLQGGT